MIRWDRSIWARCFNLGATLGIIVSRSYLAIIIHGSSIREIWGFTDTNFNNTMQATNKIKMDYFNDY